MKQYTANFTGNRVEITGTYSGLPAYVFPLLTDKDRVFFRATVNNWLAGGYAEIVRVTIH